MNPILILPDPCITGHFAHSQDTFRELGRCWAENNHVELVYSKTHLHPFLKQDNMMVCLYDRPLYENWKQGIDCDHVLWGNPEPPGVFSDESSWIFWGRHPKKLHSYSENITHDFTARSTVSIFAGKIENKLQHSKRTQSGVDWSKYIQDFSCPVGGERKYSQTGYIEAVTNSLYGLCLPGYGNKCNREIELMALGTVPVITPGVDITNYYDPPQEGVHYITASTGKELQDKTNSITQQQWCEMSRACREWYQKNCSPDGSFHTTMEIINAWR